MSSFRQFVVGNEVLRNVIDHTLKQDLITALKTVHGKPSLSPKEVAGCGITKILKDRLGIQVLLRYSPKNEKNRYNAAVTVPMLDKNNPMVNNYTQMFFVPTDFYKAVAGVNKVVKGTVNLTTGKVTGVFSEIQSEIYVGTCLLDPKFFTVEECVAIILHEIGHLITYYAAFSSTVRTNYVLQAINKAGFKNAPAEVKVNMLHTVDQQLGVKIPEKELLAAGKVDMVCSVIVREEVQKVRSELGYDYYDQRCYEAMADQFAASMGMGTPLATALAKIHKYTGSNSLLHSGFWLLLQLSLFMMNSYSWFFSALLFNAFSENTYDKTSERMKRLKERVVHELKNRNLSVEKRASLLADVERIDKEVADFTSVMPLAEWVWKKILPWGRRNEKVARLQQELESLANNSLYVKAAQLR